MTSIEFTTLRHFKLAWVSLEVSSVGSLLVSHLKRCQAQKSYLGYSSCRRSSGRSYCELFHCAESWHQRTRIQIACDCYLCCYSTTGIDPLWCRLAISVAFHDTNYWIGPRYETPSNYTPEDPANSNSIFLWWPSNQYLLRLHPRCLRASLRRSYYCSTGIQV
jgi:hypothetical protein